MGKRMGNSVSEPVVYSTTTELEKTTYLGVGWASMKVGLPRKKKKKQM